MMHHGYTFGYRCNHNNNNNNNRNNINNRSDKIYIYIKYLFMYNTCINNYGYNGTLEGEAKCRV